MILITYKDRSKLASFKPKDIVHKLKLKFANVRKKQVKINKETNQ